MRFKSGFEVFGKSVQKQPRGEESLMLNFKNSIVLWVFFSPKKVILDAKISKIVDIQKWCQNGSTAIIKGVMSNFRFFKKLKIGFTSVKLKKQWFIIVVMMRRAQKSSLKFFEQICSSLNFMFTRYRWNRVHVKTFVCVKISSSWGVGEQFSKLPSRRGLQ